MTASHQQHAQPNLDDEPSRRHKSGCIVRRRTRSLRLSHRADWEEYEAAGVGKMELTDGRRLEFSQGWPVHFHRSAA